MPLPKEARPGRQRRGWGPSRRSRPGRCAGLMQDKGVPVAQHNLALLLPALPAGQNKSGHAEGQAHGCGCRPSGMVRHAARSRPRYLIFLDKIWLNTKTARLRGHARRRERLRMGVPHGHPRITTCIAGLRLCELEAPMRIDRPINGAIFRA